MRTLSAAAGVMLIVATSAFAHPPSARPPRPEYKWCYVEPPPFPARHCVYRSIEECRPEIHGMGGYCGLNPYYVEPEPAPPRKPRRRAPR